MKSVSTNYLVGGPAGAGPVWTKELIDLCQEKTLPIDFISFHAYGLGGGPSGLDEFGNGKLYLSPNLHSVAGIVNSQRPIIEKSARPGLPVHITEWSASYSPRDPVHDSYFSAAFILEQLRRTQSGNLRIEDAIPLDQVLNLTLEEMCLKMIPVSRFSSHSAQG